MKLLPNAANCMIILPYIKIELEKVIFMAVNAECVGLQIAALRKIKGMTQSELGERLNISFQAVSKWERGETLPDTSILTDLADVLETTVDNLLAGGKRALEFKGKRLAQDAKEAVNCLERIGLLAGRDNAFYRNIVDGLSEKMNTDIDSLLGDDFLKECLVAEVIINSIVSGYYFDITEVKAQFKHEKWYGTVCDYAKRYGLCTS